jgi:hypothetical protein
MPYQVLKEGDKYLLKNKNTGVVVKKKFVSKASAIRAGQNYHTYSKKKKKNKKNK